MRVVLLVSLLSWTTTAFVSPSSGRATLLPLSLSSRTTSSTTPPASPSRDNTTKKTWQDDLEEFLSPTTNPARKQLLLQQLLNSNAEIRASVEKALRDRNIDPILTPTGKKLQAGTRAVARQINSDILPLLAKTAASPPPVVPPAADLTKVGSRLLNAFTNQLQKNIETLQGDLADPSRIPQRISKQTEELVKEASNVFSETPIGLKEPPYTVIQKTEDYEIRDYAAYTVATTNMAPGGEVYQPDNLAQSGAAFNSLAAYLFGANRQRKSMDMTTPVTTTLSGEMRFYLADEIIPEPLEQDEGKSVYETGTIVIQEIPPARLAVRRFTGFVTEGEITRQKEALLTALELDGVELDVPHGQTVGHVIFQYNPPYTIPLIRRNEIAVPVVGASDELEENWPAEDPWDADDDDDDDSAPSDTASS